MYTAILSSVIILFSAFEYRGGEPGSLFPFSAAAENYSIPGIYGNPLSITWHRGFTASAYGSRPYSLEGLSSCTSGLKYSSERAGAQLSWHSFGTGFYSENRFTAGAGFRAAEIFHAGGSVSLYKLVIDADDKTLSRTMYDGDIAAALSPFRWITIALFQGNAGAYSGQNRMELYPERSAGVLITPSDGFSVSWNLTDTSAGYLNAFAANITPSPFLTLRGGYSPEDSRFSASLSVVIENISVSYSLSSHPYLGYTHSFGISYSSSTDVKPFSYGAEESERSTKKINISSAPDEDIKGIPGLSEKSSRRILLYREKIGPVTEKALRQIGLSKDEIDSVKNSCYGLSRGSDRNRRDRKNEFQKKTGKQKAFIPSKERIKERFRRMIKAGIPAAAALRYSEIPETAERGNISSILGKDHTLSEEQKKIVRGICAE